MTFRCPHCTETPIHCWCCDECGPVHDCPACIHEREVDVAEGRRAAGEWDV